MLAQQTRPMHHQHGPGRFHDDRMSPSIHGYISPGTYSPGRMSPSGGPGAKKSRMLPQLPPGREPMGKLTEKHHSKHHSLFHSTDIYATLHCTLTVKDKYVKVLRLFMETVIEHGLTLLGSTKRGWLWRRLFLVAVNFTKVSTAGARSLLGFRNVLHCHRELFFPGFPASGRPHNNLCCHSVIQTLYWIKIFLEILPWKTIYSTIPTLTILKKSLHEVTTNVLVVMLAVRSNWEDI